MNRSEKNKDTAALAMPEDLGALAAALGSYETPENMPEAPSGVNRVDLFHERKNAAAEIVGSLGALQAGHPFLKCEGEFYDLGAHSYLVLDQFFYWATITPQFQPDKVWLTPQKFGAAAPDGRKIDARCEALVLVLPGPKSTGLPEAIAPARCALFTTKKATVPAISAHTQELERIVSDADFAAKNPGHIKLPPRFRIASTFHVTTKSASSGFSYAKVRAVPAPLTQVQGAALAKWFADPDLQAERERCEEVFAKVVAELKDLA